MRLRNSFAIPALCLGLAAAGCGSERGTDSEPSAAKPAEPKPVLERKVYISPDGQSAEITLFNHKGDYAVGYFVVNCIDRQTVFSDESGDNPTPALNVPGNICLDRVIKLSELMQPQ